MFYSTDVQLLKNLLCIQFFLIYVQKWSTNDLGHILKWRNKFLFISIDHWIWLIYLVILTDFLATPTLSLTFSQKSWLGVEVEGISIDKNWPKYKYQTLNKYLISSLLHCQADTVCTITKQCNDFELEEKARFLTVEVNIKEDDKVLIVEYRDHKLYSLQ